MRLTLPEPSLVLLVGPSGAGKSTFARAHFTPTEVISTDALRALVADDANDQSASGEAFHVLALLLNGRLRRRLLTVVDATNLRAATRRRSLQIARRYGIPAVAIAFDLPPDVIEVQNAARPGRRVEAEVVEDQVTRMPSAMAALPTEGYASVHVFHQPPVAGDIEVERVRYSAR